MQSFSLSFFFAASKFDEEKNINIKTNKVFNINDTVFNLTEPG
jgi:hypothetical protein